MRILLTILFVLLTSSSLLAQSVTLTDEEYSRIVNRLDKDKKIFQYNSLKWKKLREADPKIEYTIIDEDNIVIMQKIIVPVLNDNPLQYNTEITIKKPKKEEGFFPLNIRLVGMLETRALTDFKIGVKLLGLSPLPSKYISPLGVNAMVGIKSAGVSVSYDLPKPIANTSIHIYTGFQYKLSSPAVYGLGVGINF